MTSVLDTFGERNAVRIGLGIIGGLVLGGGLNGIEHDRAPAAVVACIAVGALLVLAAVFDPHEISLGQLGGIKRGRDEAQASGIDPEMLSLLESRLAVLQDRMDDAEQLQQASESLRDVRQALEALVDERPPM